MQVLIVKVSRGLVLAIVVITFGKFMLDISPHAAADSSCPYGYALAHVIGRTYSACAPVGSITSWGAVEPGALISMPGTPWADPHAPPPYGDGGWPYGNPHYANYPQYNNYYPQYGQPPYTSYNYAYQPFPF